MRYLHWMVLLICCVVFAAEIEAEEPHMYIFFYRAEDEHLAMEKVFDSAVEAVEGRAIALKIDIDDPSEAMIVDYYRLRRKNMPYVIVFAPDGSTKGHFTGNFTEQQLANAITSSSLPPCTHSPSCSCGCCCH